MTGVILLNTILSITLIINLDDRLRNGVFVDIENLASESGRGERVVFVDTLSIRFPVLLKKRLRGILETADFNSHLERIRVEVVPVLHAAGNFVPLGAVSYSA